MVLLIVHWDQIIRDTVDFNYINYINYISCGHIFIAFQWADVIKNGRRYIDYWRQFLVLIESLGRKHLPTTIRLPLDIKKLIR